MRRIGRTCKGAMTVATSGIILINCDAKSSKKVLRECKSHISGVTSAYLVDKKTSDAPDVIVNMDAKSKEEIVTATDVVVNMDGVRKVRYRIV